MIYIEVLTQNSNKTLDVVAVDGGYDQIHLTNIDYGVPYDSYVLYVSPATDEIGMSSFLSIMYEFGTSIYGIAFIIGIIACFVFFLKMSKGIFK